MDSLKEQTRPATKSSKPPRIEVDEEMVRRMIVGLASLDSKVVRRIPDPEEEDGNPVDFLRNTYGKCHTDD